MLLATAQNLLVESIPWSTAHSFLKGRWRPLEAHGPPIPCVSLCEGLGVGEGGPSQSNLVHGSHQVLHSPSHGFAAHIKIS